MGLFSNQVKPAGAAEKEAPPKPKSKWDLDDDGNVSFQEAASILKDTASEVMNSEKYGTFREGVMYLVFLMVFMLITLLGPNGGEATFYYTNRLKEFFAGEFRPQDVSNFDKTFQDIVTPEDVWYFIEGPLHAGLFQNQWYNGMDYNEEEKGMILSYNRLLGGARFRQIRVQPDSCQVRDEYKSIIKFCYGALTKEYEDKSGFGPVMNAVEIADGAAYMNAERVYTDASSTNTTKESCISDCKVACLDQFDLDSHAYAGTCTGSCDKYCGCLYENGVSNATACPNPLMDDTGALSSIPPRDFKYKWQSDKQLGELPFWGWIQVYPGSGYTQDLPINATEAMEIILTMKKEKFIDLSTRVIFADFTVYNAYLGLYNVIRFSLEFPATGGVIPKATYRAVQIERYSDGFTVLIFLEIILVIFVLSYFMQEMMEIAAEGFGYFKHLWNFLDITNLVIFLVVICLRLYTCDMVYGVLGVTEQLEELKATTFPNLQKVAFLMNQESNLNAFNAMIMWLKFFKYCQVSRRMSFLMRIMARASTDIFFFMLMFFIFFLGFAQAGYLAFSVNVDDFRTFNMALLTLFKSIVGDLDYDKLADANSSYGPFYYIIYYVTVLLVLLNVFLAILNDAYTAVREEDQNSVQSAHANSGGLTSVFNAIRGKPTQTKHMVSALDATLEDDDYCDLDEMKEVMRKHGVAKPDEVAMQMMKEFDTNGDGRLDAEEMKMVKKRLQEMENTRRQDEISKLGGGSGGGGGNAESDKTLITGFMNLEDRVHELAKMNETRHDQMARLEAMLAKLQ